MPSGCSLGEKCAPSSVDAPTRNPLGSSEHAQSSCPRGSRDTAREWTTSCGTRATRPPRRSRAAPTNRPSSTLPAYTLDPSGRDREPEHLSVKGERGLERPSAVAGDEQPRLPARANIDAVGQVGIDRADEDRHLADRIERQRTLRPVRAPAVRHEERRGALRHRSRASPTRRAAAGRSSRRRSSSR